MRSRSRRTSGRALPPTRSSPATRPRARTLRDMSRDWLWAEEPGPPGDSRLPPHALRRRPGARRTSSLFESPLSSRANGTYRRASPSRLRAPQSAGAVSSISTTTTFRRRTRGPSNPRRRCGRARGPRRSHAPAPSWGRASKRGMTRAGISLPPCGWICRRATGRRPRTSTGCSRHGRPIPVPRFYRLLVAPSLALRHNTICRRSLDPAVR